MVPLREIADERDPFQPLPLQLRQLLLKVPDVLFQTFHASEGINIILLLFACND